MNDNNSKVVSVRDFTTVPGARHRSDGDGSADEFYEDYLRKSLLKTAKEKANIYIDFDGTWSYPSSFTSELAMLIKTKHDVGYIRNHLHIIANDEPGMEDRFWFEYEKDY